MELTTWIAVPTFADTDDALLNCDRLICSQKFTHNAGGVVETVASEC